MSKSASRRPIVFMLFEGVQLLDISGPAEVFSLAANFCPASGYELHFIAPSETPVRSSVSLSLAGSPPARTPRSIHTLVVPGAPMQRIDAVLRDRKLLAWLDKAARRAVRTASVCTGAFLIARIGLLDGRRAATHWSVAERLALAAPGAVVDRNALFIEDGPVWSSAGVSTGIDLALAIVSRDLGPDIALKVARELVVHLARTGGQSQFSAPLELQARAGSGLTDLVAWLYDRLHLAVTVEDMAGAMAMTERSLHRRCAEHLGLSPARLLTELRLERARMLLAEMMPLAAVAQLTGFSDAAALSKAFRKRFGAPPATYGRGFRTPNFEPSVDPLPASATSRLRKPLSAS